METQAHELLKELLATPSPSGYEVPVQNVVRRTLSEFADDVTTDTHGNVTGTLNTGAALRLMFAGHCDQIGLIVSSIDKSGFLYSQTIGGWDPQQLVGQRLTIWTKDGPVPAVIARKPIHLLTPEERNKVVQQKDLWLDIGAKDKADAAAIVRIGDPVTLPLGYHDLRNGLASATKMDNTTGLWVVLEALRRCHGAELNCQVSSVSTVCEEIGLRGARTSAFGIDPQVAVAVDVTHATDCPTISKRQEGDIALGKGPVIYRGPNMNHRVTERLIDLAEDNDIDYQLAAIGRATPNDANAIQISRSGVATGLVSVPNRYMHSAVETVALGDLDQGAELLSLFAMSLEADADFTP